MLRQYIHSKRLLLKYFLALSLWTLVIFVVINIHDVDEIESDQKHNYQGRNLLDKVRRAFFTTTLSPYPEDVFIDNRAGIDSEELVRDVESRVPSLPLHYWSKHKLLASQKKNKSMCANYPSIFELQFNNIYWQTMQSSNGTFQLFGAYYDIRNPSVLVPSIRILTMIDRFKPNVTTFCQLWYDGQREPVIVQTNEYMHIWKSKWSGTNNKQGIYHPYLVTCELPIKFRGRMPISVSLVEHFCDTASNNLRVIFNQPENDAKKGFAVCVKGLDFWYEDVSTRLIEWIEMLMLQGVDKIFFYELHVHPNISKVLKHYESLGKVHTTSLTLAGGQPNVEGFQHLFLTKYANRKRQNDVIPSNDCFYQNMYRYEYLTSLDIDEVIIPTSVESKTWFDLMENVRLKAGDTLNEFDSYHIRTAHIMGNAQLLHYDVSKDIPSYFHMLRNVYRSKNNTKRRQFVRFFYDPQQVVLLHNNFPIRCLHGVCRSYSITQEEAQLQYYSSDCDVRSRKACREIERGKSVLDNSIWRYKDELIRRCTKTLEILEFFLG